MRIYNKIIFQWDRKKQQYIQIHCDSYEYDGEVALCAQKIIEPPVSLSYTMPPDFAKPWIKRQGQKIGRIGEKPIEYYPDAMTAGFTDEQTQAQDLLTKRAIGGDAGVNAAQGELAKTLGGSYLGQGVDDSYLQDTLAGKPTSVDQSFLGNTLAGRNASVDDSYLKDTLAGQDVSADSSYLKDTLAGRGVNSNTSYLQDTAAGKYLDFANNPAMKATFESLLENTMPGVNTSARQAGMYGSSAAELMKGKALGELGAQMYQPERARQLAAQSQLTDLISREMEAERGRQYGAEMGMTDIENQIKEAERGRRYGAQTNMTDLLAQASDAERARQFGAESQLTNLGQEASEAERQRQFGAQLGLTELSQQAKEDERNRMQNAMAFAPTLAQESVKDIGLLGSVGEEKQAMNQQLINDLIAKYEFGQMEPWTRAGMTNDLWSGLPMGSTTANLTEGQRTDDGRKIKPIRWGTPDFIKDKRKDAEAFDKFKNRSDVGGAPKPPMFDTPDNLYYPSQTPQPQVVTPEPLSTTPKPTTTSGGKNKNKNKDKNKKNKNKKKNK